MGGVRGQQQVTDYPAPREDTEWGRARLPAHPGTHGSGLPRLGELRGNGGRTAGGGWAGRGPLPRPLAQVDPGNTGRTACPAPGSHARGPRRAHPVGMPAPDKGPALGSPAGATARPEPSRCAQPRRGGRDRGPEPAQTWRPGARVEGAPLPVRP